MNRKRNRHRRPSSPVKKKKNRTRCERTKHKRTRERTKEKNQRTSPNKTSVPANRQLASAVTRRARSHAPRRHAETRRVDSLPAGIIVVIVVAAPARTDRQHGRYTRALRRGGFRALPLQVAVACRSTRSQSASSSEVATPRHDLAPVRGNFFYFQSPAEGQTAIAHRVTAHYRPAALAQCTAPAGIVTAQHPYTAPG